MPAPLWHPEQSNSALLDQDLSSPPTGQPLMACPCSQTKPIGTAHAQPRGGSRLSRGQALR